MNPIKRFFAAKHDHSAAMECVEHDDGSCVLTVNGDAVVTSKTNAVTGGITLSAGGVPIDLGAGTPEQIGFIDYLKIGFAGDSIANGFATAGYSPIFWAATELYPCDYRITMNTSVGGTSSSHLISNQISTLEAMVTKPDVVIVQSLQNDYIGSYANADTYFAYIQAYSERALIAGVKLVVIGSHPPKSSAPDVATAISYLNRRIEEYCNTVPGNFFFDVFSAWRKTDAADSSGVAWRGVSNSANAFSDDGTHPTGLAGRAAANLILPVLQRYARPISPRAQVAVAYNDTTGNYNNVLGANGLMIGTGGTYNSVNNTNVAGVAAAAYNRWELTDGNGIIATPTIVTGDDGYLYQQLVLSGTASADATVSLVTNYVQNVASGNFQAEAIVDTISLTGIRSIGMSCQMVGGMTLGSSTANQINVGTARLHFRTPVVLASNSGFMNRSNSISVAIKSGATVSGTIRVGRVGVHRVS